jgi:hypothetical protein
MRAAFSLLPPEKVHVEKPNEGVASCAPTTETT